MKYVDTAIVFDEVPDEITLAINISGCPCNCEGCHSSYLAEDTGVPLDYETIKGLIEKNRGITCLCFMGGDAHPEGINYFSKRLREDYPSLKIAWYSGRQELAEEIDLDNFNFIKLGPYVKERGPLTEPTTNQRFYRVIHTEVPSVILVEETHRFWKNYKEL